MLMVYGLGFIFAYLPNFYMNQYRGQNEREMIQSKSLATGYKLICGLQTNEQSVLRHETVIWTLRTMTCLTMLSVAIFKLI